MSLERDGERVIVEQYQSSPSDWVIYLMHVASYRFAKSFVEGARVLDYGCGSGYGAAMIAEVAAQVIGVDAAAEAVEYARQHFGRPNLDFHVVPVDASLPMPDGCVDVVLSFQVIEHVADPLRYLSEVRRVLHPDGCAIVITPDRRSRLFAFQRPWNRWHVLEYDPQSLASVLGSHFSRVEIQQMSGPPALVDIELRRYRKVRWLMLPATLPFVPDSIRRRLLNAVHASRPRPRATESGANHAFDVSDIHIAPEAAPSLNLVAIARV